MGYPAPGTPPCQGAVTTWLLYNVSMRVFTKQSSFYFCVKLAQGVCSPHQLPLWQGGSDPTGSHIMYMISIFACALPTDPTSVPCTTYHVSRILYLVPRTSNFVPRTSHPAPRIWHITPHISLIISMAEIPSFLKKLEKQYLKRVGTGQ